MVESNAGLLIGIHISVLLLIAFLLVYSLLLLKRDTYQKRMSSDLDKERNRFLLIKEAFSISPVPSIVISPEDDRIESINDAFLFLSGYNRSDFKNIGVGSLNLLSKDDSLRDLTRTAIAFGSVSDWSFDLVTKPGSIRNVETSARKVTIMGKDYVLVAFNDITDQTRRREHEHIERQLRAEIINARMTCNTIRGFCDDVLPKVTQSFGFTTGLIRFYDEEHNTLVRMGTYNYSELIRDDIEDGISIDEHDNISSVVAETCEPIICDDVMADPINKTFKEAIEYNHIKSVATFPLTSTTNQLIGTFCMWSEYSIDGLIEMKWMLSRIISLIAIGIEQMQADEQIASTQARYLKLFENAKDAIIFHDLEGNITDANPSAIDLFGYSLDEFKGGLTVHDIVADPIDTTKKELLENLRILETVQFDETFKSKGGDTIFAEVSSSLTYIFDEPVVIAIIHNVTQTRLIETKLKESEEQYRHLYETATAGLFRIEMEEGMLVSVNTQGAKLAGYDSIQEIPVSGLKISNRIDRSTLETLKKILITQGEVHDVEVVWKREDGGQSHFLASLKYYESNGYVEGSFIDITDRKTVENALVTSEEKLRSIIDSSPMGIHTFELDGRRLCLNGINTSSVTMLGEDNICSIGQEISTIYPYSTNETLRESLLDVVESGNDLHDELEIIESAEDSTYKVLEYWAFRSYEGNLVVMIRDITQAKKAQLEKAHMTKLISDKNKELEQLLYVTSHDLRSPLVNIIGFGGELEDNIIELVDLIDKAEDINEAKSHIENLVGERLFESTRFIQASARKIDILLNNLLKLSRIGRKKMNLEDINTEDMIATILATLQFQIQSVGARIEVFDLPPCKADLDQFNQVFTNIIENAIKYRKSKGPCLIKIYGTEDENSCTYTVVDNGIGIKKEHQDKVFQLFHQLNPKVGTGFGMGMSIVKRIVLKHNGKVWIESEEGKGTSVFVSLPKKRGKYSEYQRFEEGS